MRNSIRLITATVALSIAGWSIPSFAKPVAADPNISFTGFTTAERVWAVEAIDLFRQGGLPLPRLSIIRHHDRKACHGFEGLHTTSGRRSVIDLCAEGADAYVQRVLIHELGHAWSFHYLSDEHRSAFQAVRGWTVWIDYTRAEWEDNGAEQAAEIILWGLSDHAVPVLKIDHHTCADLKAGYVALTGLQPLHGYTNLCDEKVVAQRS